MRHRIRVPEGVCSVSVQGVELSIVDGHVEVESEELRRNLLTDPTFVYAGAVKEKTVPVPPETEEAPVPVLTEVVVGEDPAPVGEKPASRRRVAPSPDDDRPVKVE